MTKKSTPKKGGQKKPAPKPKKKRAPKPTDQFELKPIAADRQVVVYKKMGRPTLWSKELAEEICALLVKGYSLRAIEDIEGMPCKATMMMWLYKHKDFLDQYTRAQKIKVLGFKDDIIDIADDGTNDYVERERKDGSTYIALDAEHVMRSKLRIDARRYLIGCHHLKYRDNYKRPEKPKALTDATQPQKRVIEIVRASDLKKANSVNEPAV